MSCPVLENEFLQIAADPRHGGRIIRFYDKRYAFEHLWYDAERLPVNPELDYDGNFAGGMDELLPNDPPERGYPDHGELWMTPLTCRCDGKNMSLEGELPVSKLYYRREMELDGTALVCRYLLENRSGEALDFLWKLHGAMQITPGDKLFAPAGCIQAADPGDWSKVADGMPRRWREPYIVPAMDGTSDFFYLTDLEEGRAVLSHASGRSMECRYDLAVFPALWIFASFGRLNESRTMILEPCTNYPMFLADAVRNNCCAHLEAGETLTTTLRWIAG